MLRVLCRLALAAVVLATPCQFAFSAPCSCHVRLRPGAACYDWNYRHYPYRHDQYAPSRRRAYDDLYPKFYGGFHSRHYTTLGVPPGDVGLRGNGIYWLPW